MFNPDAPAESTDAVLARQSTLNQSTRGQWNLYRSHREELEKLLVPSRSGGRICVLGAGNCNDLDLRWLLQVYRLVQLVDLDGPALERAARFQKVAEAPALRLRGSIDLTGIAARLGAWEKARPASPADADVQACLQAASAPADTLAAALDGPFDLVLSPCVLSQLLTPIRDVLGANHPAHDPLLAAVRRRHFQLMLDLLAPGGRAVFACDLFSSATVKDLARAPREELPGLLRKRVAAGRHFSGLDPASIQAVLTRDRLIAPQVATVRHAAPWLWHLALSKTYLVYALTFNKTSAPASRPASSPDAAPRDIGGE